LPASSRRARHFHLSDSAPDAALLDLRRLRVLGVVDEVAVQVLRDHPLGLGLHPRRHERRQVAHGNPIEHELLADQPHRVHGAHALLRQGMVGRALEQEAVAVLARQGVELSSGDGTFGRVHSYSLHDWRPTVGETSDPAITPSG
jgi:hypothetical protein